MWTRTEIAGLIGIDPHELRLYIGLMAKEKPTQAIDLEIRKLESRIEELIRVCDRLKDENETLRSQQETLSTERSQLIEKNEMVRARVEAMITRLRAMERHP